MTIRALAALALSLCATSALAQTTWPNQRDNYYVLKDFRFASGETIPELKMHYVTLGTPKKNAAGEIVNGVILLHGTYGSAANFLTADFAGELFGAGQPLDASKYYLIIPDALGSGKSTKPSDGLKAKFPKYNYDDMVDAQYRLVTEGLGVKHLRLVIGNSMGGMQAWVCSPPREVLSGPM